MARSIVIFITLVLFTLFSLTAELIIQKKDEGVIVHSNVTQDVFFKEQQSTTSSKSLMINSSVSQDGEIMKIVLAVCSRENVDARLIKSIINVESRFFPFAVSRVGAMGLMQLMPSTASSMGIKNPFDVEQNINGGVRYFKYLLVRFNNNVALALAAYNAGPEAVERYKGIPPYQETMAYVKKVLYLYERDGGTVHDPLPNIKVFTDKDGSIVIMDKYTVQ